MKFSCFITSYNSVTHSHFSIQKYILYTMLGYSFDLYVSRLSCLTVRNFNPSREGRGQTCPPKRSKPLSPTTNQVEISDSTQ